MVTVWDDDYDNVKLCCCAVKNLLPHSLTLSLTLSLTMIILVQGQDIRFPKNANIAADIHFWLHSIHVNHKNGVKAVTSLVNMS